MQKETLNPVFVVVTCLLLYVTFYPILACIRDFLPQTCVHRDVCINPNSSGQHRWILIATDYFLKWIEAIPTKRATDAVIMGFLEENILARFGCPEVL